MNPGSSALNYEPNKQINTPCLKATMRENSYGVSCCPWGVTGKYHAAIEWKGLVIFATNFGGYIPHVRMCLKSYKGATEIASTDLGSSRGSLFEWCWNRPVFYDTGETLVFDYTFGMSVWNIDDIIMRKTTSGGTVWSAGETVYGTGGSVIGTIATVGATRIYSLVSLRNLYVSQKVAGVWGTILLGDIGKVPGNYVTNRVLAARSYNNEDIIIYSRGISVRIPGTSSFRKGAWLKRIRTDGQNILGTENMICQSSDHDNSFRMSNMSSGISYFYLGFKIMRTNHSKNDGRVLGYRNNFCVVKSSDALRWGVLQNIGITIGLPDTTYTFVVIGGATVTSPELSVQVLWDTFPYPWSERIDILKSRHGTTSLDISDNIVSYNNQNNDRISLTLGNYK